MTHHARSAGVHDGADGELLHPPVQLTVAWRPSTFLEAVVHAAVEGQTVHVTDGVGEWVLAVCGQSVHAMLRAGWRSTRCPDCEEWLDQSTDRGVRTVGANRPIVSNVHPVLPD